MTADELYAKLSATGLPVVYLEWPENAAPTLPYLCFLESYQNNFAADGTMYYGVPHWQVELYEPLRDPGTEGTVEAVLSALGFWEKTPEWIDTEKCYEILYEIEV